MKRTLVLHPFLLAIYPILFLLAFNITEIPPAQALRPLAISLTIAAVLLLLFGGLTKNWQQGGLTVSLILLLFFSYGHVYRLLEEADSPIANHMILGSIWLILFTAGFLLKWKIGDTKPITRTLNIVTAVLLIYPLYTIAIFLLQSGGDVVLDVKESPLAAYQSTTPVTSNELPDIYYIIMDGYGRSDVLQELYAYDNSEFTQFLEDRGFYVAKDARSNYITTLQSISSSLNLDYLDQLDALNSMINTKSHNGAPLSELIHHSNARSFLEDRGYKTVSFATAYAPTTISDADMYIPYEQQRIVNDLESLLLVGSATVALGNRMDQLFSPFFCEVQRDKINYSFTTLQEIAAIDEATFTIAHIVSPHPPFVFGANGEAVDRGGCVGKDGNYFLGSPEEYREGYAQQTAYINRQLEQTIDHILRNTSNPPIIILQGDHGPGLMLEWGSIENSCLRERSSILSAYYFPEKSDLLYDSITPVNSFRVLFNTYFDAELQLVEDRTYFRPIDTLYKFIEITDQIEASCVSN